MGIECYAPWIEDNTGFFKIWDIAGYNRERLTTGIVIQFTARQAGGAYSCLHAETYPHEHTNKRPDVSNAMEVGCNALRQG